MRKFIIVLVLAAIAAVAYLGSQNHNFLAEKVGLGPSTKTPRTLSVSPKARPDDAEQLQKDWQEAQRKRRVLEEAARNAK